MSAVGHVCASVLGFVAAVSGEVGRVPPDTSGARHSDRAGMTEAPVAENPLLEGLGPRRAPEPCVLVIFGASGDLTHRKIFPALYALACRKLLPEKLRDRRRGPLGLVGRRVPRPDGARGARVRPRRLRPGRLGLAGQGDALHLARLRRREPRTTSSLERLNELDEERGTRGNRVYYLAIPPQAMPTVVKELGERRKAEGWTRLIVEKPFGHDLASARELTSADRRALHRGRGLPHRPLPRQGNGPEHARAAVRERHLRADLEPPVRRPRPDHGRRDPRRRGPRRPTTSKPVRSGTSSRTTRSNSSR